MAKKSLQYYNLKPGMKLELVMWFRTTDRRTQDVEVLEVEGERKTIRGKVKTATGSIFDVYHNGRTLAMMAGTKEIRVTFRMETEKNELFSVESKKVVLADHNGETAIWNVIGIGEYQLPDDECCGSWHPAIELMSKGYTLVKELS